MSLEYHRTEMERKVTLLTRITLLLVVLLLSAVFILSGCTTHSSMDHSQMDHSEMNHSGMEPPASMVDATDAKFPVGTAVLVQADHMPGMDGASGVVSGAYATTLYSVSYTPTTGGAEVRKHKWVVHEELAESSAPAFQAGDTVTLNASHMQGMKGATATIDTAEQTTVYMIDYVPTDGKELVTNHMWVSESELKAK